MVGFRENANRTYQELYDRQERRFFHVSEFPGLSEKTVFLCIVISVLYDGVKGKIHGRAVMGREYSMGNG